MSPAVGADSLSSLTHLASEPPLYPQDTALRHGPIILYIARVPGSKDVFLTPLKPLQKVVTAADVENCLYYLHARTPADKSLMTAPNNERQEPVQQPVQKPVQRPVQESQIPLAPNSNWDSAVKRKSIPVPSHRSSQTGNALYPRPLPPIPPYPVDENWPTAPDTSHLPLKEPQHPPYPDSDWPKAPPALYATPLPSAPSQMALRYHSSSDDYTPPPLPPRRSSSSLQSHEHFDHPTPTQPVTELTLIRRHPATGEQWNVADITDPPVYELEPNSQSNNMSGSQLRKPGQPLYIDIKTTGYSKFLQGQNSFTRRLWMEGSVFENWQSDRRHSRSSQSVDSRLGPSPPNLDRRNSSDYCHHSTNLTGLEQDPVMHRLSVDSTKKRSRTKGYTFTSPWNGRCEFVSANMGTSLKCRHSLPSTGLSADPTPPTTVSELRFNLPTAPSTARPPSTSSQPSRPSRFHFHRRKSTDSFEGPSQTQTHTQTHQRGYSDSLSHIERQRSNDRRSYDETQNSDSRLDLSLGQELAGGGFAGKQVKLGKLIVEYEGLKMLDLIVAANMGLWWRAYEKTL